MISVEGLNTKLLASLDSYPIFLKNLKPIDKWYSQIYPIIVQTVKSLDDLQLKIGIAAVATSSWVSTILNSDLDGRKISKFEEYWESIPENFDAVECANKSRNLNN